MQETRRIRGESLTPCYRINYITSRQNATRETCMSYEDPNQKCTEWEFDHSFYRSTIFTEFSLVCDRNWYVSASKSVYQIGYLVSSVLFGWMSDRYGRRLAFRVSTTMELLLGVAQASSMSIEFFLAARFFMGVGAYARYLTGMLIGEYNDCLKRVTDMIFPNEVLEWAGPRIRARIKVIRGIGWNISYLMLPGVFYVVRDFRYMQIMVCAYQFLFIYWIWKIPESPSWIVVYGKREDAEKLLQEAVKVNKLGSPESVTSKLDTLKENLLKQQKEGEEEESKKSILEMWRSPVLLKYSLCMYFIWFSLGFVGYGFSYNVGELGGSIYINTFIMACLEVVARVVTYFTVDRFQRKTLFYIFVFSGSASVFMMIPFIFAPWGTPYRVFFALLGSFFIGSAWSQAYLQAAEIFPTGYRQIGVGSCSVASRVGSVLAPFIKELSEWTHFSVPMAIFGTLGLISGLLMFFLPETKDKPIPNTIKEAEVTSRRKSVVA